jgi:hypothetical protein
MDFFLDLLADFGPQFVEAIFWMAPAYLWGGLASSTRSLSSSDKIYYLYFLRMHVGWHGCENTFILSNTAIEHPTKFIVSISLWGGMGGGEYVFPASTTI